MDDKQKHTSAVFDAIFPPTKPVTDVLDAIAARLGTDGPMAIEPGVAEKYSQQPNDPLAELAKLSASFMGPMEPEETGVSVNPEHVRWQEWAVETFGEVAANKLERALRFFEEAMETAHAAGMRPTTALRIMQRIYSKEPGELQFEIAQSYLTLATLAVVNGTDLQSLGRAEFARLQLYKRDYLRARHEVKRQAGITADAG